MQELTTNNRKSGAAIAYSTILKWAIFPCHGIHDGQCTCGKDCSKPGKHPRTLHGFKDATKEPEQIKKWWEMWPNANIGVPTGETNGFFVVDVDPRHGGFETLEELEDTYGKLPHTVTAITGSGGNHFLFKYPGWSVKSGGNVLGSGIDIRGDGGYFIAAPSNHYSGGAYMWELSSHPVHTPIAEAPEWLLNLLITKSKSDAAGKLVRTPSSEWVKLMKGVEDGGRTDAATSLIGHLLRRHVDSYLAYEIVMLWNSKNNPPLDEYELNHTFDSIGRKELRRRGTK
jgi:hypothetical protein